jgi:hypothetical protein
MAPPKKKKPTRADFNRVTRERADLFRRLNTRPPDGVTHAKSGKRAP